METVDTRKPSDRLPLPDSQAAGRRRPFRVGHELSRIIPDRRQQRIHVERVQAAVRLRVQLYFVKSVFRV